MVSEMSSTTQRGAAAAAVEARRTRAMLRREVRSSILCAAVQPCVSRECSACWTAATTHVCNALAMLRTRWFSSRKSHRCVLQTSRKQACKESNASGLQDTSKPRRTYPEFTRWILGHLPEACRQARRFISRVPKSDARLPQRQSAVQTIAAMES